MPDENGKPTLDDLRKALGAGGLGFPGAAMPADPFAGQRMTPGVIACTALHETFLDLLAAGFTEDQSLTFLARACAAAQQGGTPGD